MASFSPHPQLRLPSIHEMLPNHRHRCDPPHYLPPLDYHYDGSRPAPTRSLSAHTPATRSMFPAAGPSRLPSPDTSFFHADVGSADDFDFDYTLIGLGGGSGSGGKHGRGEQREAGRKYQCETCGKLFNRPSSLRIHANTHTGATPFQCPYPSCGRAFNVNSNMRRHYRNHGAPPLPSSSGSSSSDSSSSSSTPKRKPVAIAPSPTSTPTPPPTLSRQYEHPISHSTALFLGDDADPTSVWSHSVPVHPQPVRPMAISLQQHPVLHSHSESHTPPNGVSWPPSSLSSALDWEYTQPYPHHTHAHALLALQHQYE